jgi:predicted hydrocarbon binding protein
MSEYSTSISSGPVIGMVLEGVKEIIGQVGVSAVMAHCNETYRHQTREMSGKPIEDIQRLGGGLEALYGVRGGKGILLRAGREAFQNIVNRHVDELGLDVRFRLLPLNKRIPTGLIELARWLGSSTDAAIEISESGAAWVWDVHECPWCSDRRDTAGMCHFMIGLLQEYMSWASGHDVYLVNEVECPAMGGHVCRLVIDKQPLG